MRESDSKKMAQSEHFNQAAHELGYDEDELHFEEALKRKVARQKQPLTRRLT